MTIQLQLNEEQTDALAIRVAEWKDRNNFTTETAEDYLAAILMAEIGGYVFTDFSQATQRIAELASSKSYEDRKALIQGLTQQLSSQG